MVSDYLEVVISFVLFLLMLIFFYDFIFHKSEIRTVLLEVGIDLGLLKKALLKTSKIILMCSNSLARQFSSMFHAKCLLPRLNRLLPVRSCLQNFYQCRLFSFNTALLLCSKGNFLQEKLYHYIFYCL